MIDFRGRDGSRLAEIESLGFVAIDSAEFDGVEPIIRHRQHFSGGQR